MKVSFCMGAHTYAVIEKDGARTDIRLSPGKSAAKSLHEYADEQMERIAHLTHMATLAREAASAIEARLNQSRKG